jgi:hypothetical protein
MFQGRPAQAIIDALKAGGWRWSGFRKEWHNPSKFAKPPVPFVDEGLVDYSSERAERLESRAEKIGSQAQSQYQRAKAIADVIPLGQPILVGHHSERRHRRDIERIQGGFGKAFAGFGKQKELVSRAASSERFQEAKVSDPGMISRRLKKGKTDLAYMLRMLPQIEPENQEEYKRKIEIEREGVVRDEGLLAAAGPLPEAAGDVAKRMKSALRKEYPSIKVTSSSGRSTFIEARLPWVGDPRANMKPGEIFSPALRNAALDAEYGAAFVRNRENPVAGNINTTRIVLRAATWKVALEAVGMRV